MSRNNKIQAEVNKRETNKQTKIIKSTNKELVLWENQYNWQTLTKLTKDRQKRSKLIALETKENDHDRHQGYPKNHKDTL